MAVTTTEQEAPSLKPVLITTEELHRHNTPSDLWISIQGKVYDVTKWVSNHPGGELPLLNLAGEEVTDAFIAFHPPSAWAHLDRFHIGHLSDYSISPVSKDFRRLAAEFSRLGLYKKKGHGVALSLTFVLALFITSISLAVLTSSPFLHVLSAATMGFLWIQSGWVGHDAGHYNVMTSRPFNRFVQILTGNCLTGISIGWWRRNHNFHHVACNSLDHDPDLQHLPLFCISNKFFSSLTSVYYNRKMTFDSIARFFISYQHFTFYPVMCAARLNLFGQSLCLLFSKTPVPDRLQEIAGCALFWIWYPLLVSYLPNWNERVIYVLVSFSVTALQHVQFTLNHFTGDCYVGPPKGNDWFQKQTAGTMDIECPAWMDWFHGGLQFQVEHHLFPRLPRCHLRSISPIVRELCKKHGLEYKSAGFIEANRLTLKVLRNAAMQARENLVWEALNHIG